MATNSRSIIKYALFLLCTLAFLVIGKKVFFSSSSSVPLFLKHDTFLQGVGMTSLGKEYLLRYKGDRVLFCTAKEQLKKQRRQWKQHQLSSIPLIIHSLWLSEQQVPEEVLQARASLKERNPECQITVWDRKAILQLFPESEHGYFLSLPPVMQRSIATARILYYIGGAVLDPEILCLASFKPLFSSADWIVTFEPPLRKATCSRRLWLSPAFIAAIPKHPLTKAWLDAMYTYVRSNETRPTSSRKMYMEGVLLPLIQCFTSAEVKGYSAYAVSPTCFVPIAPHLIASYLKKLSGETTKEKRHFFGKQQPPFSRVVRETFGLHQKGGTLGRETE